MLQASKWIKLPILISFEEMKDLMEHLNPFHIFITGSLTARGLEISHSEFLDLYKEYVDTLSQGLKPDEARYRLLFSTIFTNTLDAIYTLLLEEDKQLIRLKEPVVQLQGHRLHYSQADHSFRSMTFGAEGISWGIQFSYPQLYQNEKTQEILQVGPDLPNTQLFKKLQKWVRDATIPTSFLVEGKKINFPVRLGKQCVGWINKHPHLVEKGFRVQVGL